jgi:alpha-galactosidase/6-phospho-beta-glucosidase family protein
MVDDIPSAKAMLKEYFEVNKKYLPQFSKKGEAR